MLKDLFSNRLFIGALVFFIFSVVGVTWYIWHVESEGVEEFAPAEEHFKGRAEQPQVPVSDVDGSGSAGVDAHLEGADRQSAQQKNGAASGGDAEVPQLSEAEMERILAENRAQQAQRRADYIAEWGEPPSSDGSYKHYRDNHGDVHRHYRGTVAIQDYEYTTMFAPTPEELERYKRLRTDLKAATLADVGGSWENPSPEVQRLDTALKSLVESAQRETPFPNGFRYYGANNSGFPSNAENARLRSIALREFYQRFGMEHLYELREEPTKFYQKY